MRQSGLNIQVAAELSFLAVSGGASAMTDEQKKVNILILPANQRVDFENGWLIKSSFITKDEHKVCQLNRTKVQMFCTFITALYK